MKTVYSVQSWENRQFKRAIALEEFGDALNAQRMGRPRKRAGHAVINIDGGPARGQHVVLMRNAFLTNHK